MTTLALLLLAQAPLAATVTAFPAETLGTMPRDFTGLSYEAMQLTDPEFFSPANKGLIALFRRLSPHGVLRLGANTSELGWWKPTPNTPQPPEITSQIARTGEYMNRTAYPIEPRAIDHLAGFLRATGWTLVYGLNFGAGTPARDAEEAAYVAKKTGRSLDYFQVGNEPSYYTSPENTSRPKGWGFDDYVREWTAYADAVTAKVPGARFGGPDVGSGSDWIPRFGERMGPRLGGRLVALTGHYYPMGPAGSPGINWQRLLAPNGSDARTLRAVRPVADRIGAGYRMTEGNSCYRGGQPAVSDALAGALWGGDYELNLAALGGKGVNLHGGGGAQVAASLGNHWPGARNAADLEKAKLGSFYTPIAGNREAGFTARPVFYGMMLAQRFVGATLVRTAIDTGGANATAYAARSGKGCLVALFNKDATKDLRVSLKGLGSGVARVWRLTGPAIDATEGVTLAGAEVGKDGAWRPAKEERGDLSAIDLPRASAALVMVGG